jgi:hypothetical protein
MVLYDACTCNNPANGVVCIRMQMYQLPMAFYVIIYNIYIYMHANDYLQI